MNKTTPFLAQSVPTKLDCAHRPAVSDEVVPCHAWIHFILKGLRNESKSRANVCMYPKAEYPKSVHPKLQKLFNPPEGCARSWGE